MSNAISGKSKTAFSVVEVKGTMGSKARLAPDPSVSVSDIMKAVTAVTQQLGISDMLKLLNSKHRMTWKSAPDAEWLGSTNISTLCEKLFQVHSNGVLSSNKLQQALMKVQTTEGRLNFSKLHDAAFLDRCDEQIRVACAQYREIKKDATKYVRCLKRASPEEKKNIDSVLSVLVFEDEEAEKPEDEIPRKCTEVEVEPAPVAAADSGEPRRSPKRVFQRVLEKKVSDPTSPGKSDTACGSSRSKKAKSPKASFKSKLALLQLDKDEEKELLLWMEQAVPEPAKKKKKTKTGASSDQSKPKVRAAQKKPAAKTDRKQVSFSAKKCTFKHRATSTAYHKAKSEALKAGASREDALLAARAASQKVADDISSGVLKET